MRSAFSLQMSRSGSRPNAYSLPDTSSLQEPSVYHGKMRTAPGGTTPVDIILGVSAEIVHAITVHQNKMMFQSPIGVMKEIVWDYSENSVHFVLDDGSTSPTFAFPVLTELEAHFTAILALPDLEKPPEQIYIGVLIGENVPSPIQQRRASHGSSSPAILPISTRRELLIREQPVRNAMSRERLGLEYIRNGHLCFTCSISGDLRGLTLGVHHLRVFPSPDCHDRSACLFYYSYEQLEACQVAGTRLELRFRTTHQLAKQPSFLVFQSLESQYIREAIWYLKNGTYMDASLREILASPTRTPRSSNADTVPQGPDIVTSPRASALMFFSDADNLKQRIDACCRVIGCENLVEYSENCGSRLEEASASNVIFHINSGELSHMNRSVRTNPSTSRVLTNGLCEFHALCLSLAPSDALMRQKPTLSRDKQPLPAKSMQPLTSLLQSTHYAKMFKFQGLLLKRQNGRTFHLRKVWHPKFVVLFETPVGGFLCYYDKITHCPGMTDTPKERRMVDLSSVICIRPVSASSPVNRTNCVSAPATYAFDVVTLYRTWTFAAVEREEYEIWLHVLTECVEKHATIAPDRILRFPVKLAMTGQSCPTEATSLEIAPHGLSFCTGHDAEVVLNCWYYTDLAKWSVVFQQGYTCCLLKCRSPAPTSPGSPRTTTGDMITQDYLFRTAEASTICLAIEFYVGKCMAKLEVLAGQYLEEARAQKNTTTLAADPGTPKRAATSKLQLQLVQEHRIENVSLAPVLSPEKTTSKLPSNTNSVPEQVEMVTTVLEEATLDVTIAAEIQPSCDSFVQSAKKNECGNDKSLIHFEEPTKQSLNALVDSFGAACESQPCFKDEAETMMVEMSNTKPAASTQSASFSEDKEEQNEIVINPQELDVQTYHSLLIDKEVSNDNYTEFESIDLGDAIIEVTSIREQNESDHAKIAVVSVELQDDKVSPPPPPVLTAEEVLDEYMSPTMSKCNETELSQAHGCSAKIEADRPEIASDIFKIEFTADDISTHDICLDNIDNSTANTVTSTIDSEVIDTSVQLPQVPNVLQSLMQILEFPSAPLLLLEYDASWPGETQVQDEIVEDKEVEDLTRPEEEEDSRESECEASEAFISCASEVELIPEPPLPGEEDISPVDELFE